MSDTSEHVLTPAERDEYFRPLNDRTWGEGNWVKCDRCPDSFGNPSYHHRDFHRYSA